MDFIRTQVRRSAARQCGALIVLVLGQNKLRAQIQAKGTLTGLRNFAEALRCALPIPGTNLTRGPLRAVDSKNTFTVNRNGFEQALSNCALFLNTQEVETLMSHYDMSAGGTMMYESLLSGLRGTLNHRRKGIVQAVFDRVAQGADSVPAGAVAQAFDGSRHPDVASGLMSAQDVTEQVAELFGRKQLSYEDFDRNMSEISCCYDKDSDFVDMVLQCFGEALQRSSN